MPFSFTPAAAKHVKGIMAEKGHAAALRIQVRRVAGSDRWAVTLEPHATDVLMVSGIPVVADEKTQELLDGLVIDWVHTPQGAGFGVYAANLPDLRSRK